MTKLNKQNISQQKISLKDYFSQREDEDYCFAEKLVPKKKKIWAKKKTKTLGQSGNVHMIKIFRSDYNLIKGMANKKT